jgi:hypothetical protein
MMEQTTGIRLNQPFLISDSQGDNDYVMANLVQERALNLEQGQDVMLVNGSVDLLVATGAGNDVLAVDNSDGILVSGGQGSDEFTVTNSVAYIEDSDLSDADTYNVDSSNVTLSHLGNADTLNLGSTFQGASLIDVRANDDGTYSASIVQTELVGIGPDTRDTLAEVRIESMSADKLEELRSQLANNDIPMRATEADNSGYLDPFQGSSLMPETPEPGHDNFQLTRTSSRLAADSAEVRQAPPVPQVSQSASSPAGGTGFRAGSTVPMETVVVTSQDGSQQLEMGGGTVSVNFG